MDGGEVTHLTKKGLRDVLLLLLTTLLAVLKEYFYFNIFNWFCYYLQN